MTPIEYAFCRTVKQFEDRISRGDILTPVEQQVYALARLIAWDVQRREQAESHVIPIDRSVPSDGAVLESEAENAG